jgi:hypothetical protein
MPVAAMARVIALQESHDNIDPEDGLPRRYAPRNDKTVYDKMDCHVVTLLAMTKQYMTRWIDTSLRSLQ